MALWGSGCRDHSSASSKFTPSCPGIRHRCPRPQPSPVLPGVVGAEPGTGEGLASEGRPAGWVSPPGCPFGAESQEARGAVTRT